MTEAERIARALGIAQARTLQIDDVLEIARTTMQSDIMWLLGSPYSPFDREDLYNIIADALEVPLESLDSDRDELLSERAYDEAFFDEIASMVVEESDNSGVWFRLNVNITPRNVAMAIALGLSAYRVIQEYRHEGGNR